MKLTKFKTMLTVIIAGAVVYSARANTLVVGNDPTQCKDAKYSSINAAIAAAQNGDTIRVCAGTYTENVIVNKSVELVGARKTNAAAKGRDQSNAKESIVVK